MATIEARLAAFLVRGRKMVEELTAELDELEAAASGDATVGQQVNRLFKQWPATWAERYKQAYVFTSRAKTGGELKKLLRSLKVEDIEARMRQYVDSNDPFYRNARHSIDIFVKSINKFTGLSDGTDDETFLTAPVADCRHTPRCKSDQEHTRRRTEDMRA